LLELYLKKNSSTLLAVDLSSENYKTVKQCLSNPRPYHLDKMQCYCGRTTVLRYGIKSCIL